MRAFASPSGVSIRPDPSEYDLASAAGFYPHTPPSCRPGCIGCRDDLPTGLWVSPEPRAAVRLGATIRLAPTLRGPAPRPPPEPIEVPLPEGLALRPYQRDAVAFAAERKGTLIADEMGVGKTVQAIALANYLWHPTRILVLAPATLQANWKREIERWDARAGDVHILEKASDLPPPIADHRQWCVVNADKLIAGKTATSEQPKERAGGLWSALMSCYWHLLIIDEVHRLKNPKALRTPRVLGQRKGRKGPAKDGLVQRAKRTVALTGTPIPNRVREIWPIISTLAPDAFARESEFLFRYCGATQRQVLQRGGHGEMKKVWDFTGATNLPELEARLRGSCMIRRLKRDVLSDLPPKTREIVPVQSEALTQASDSERQGWLRLAPEITQIQAKALLAQALGEAYEYEQALDKLDTALQGIDAARIASERQAIGIAKVPIVVEHVQSRLQDGSAKVVVMAHHHAVIEAICEKMGKGCVALYGRTPVKQRDAIVTAFQTDPSVRVLVGGIHAAGVGLTLTAAKLMVMAEADWQPGVLAQCEDRIHRLGQDAPVVIQYLVADGSIEALVVASALRKERTIREVLDGTRLGLTNRKWPPATEDQRQTCCKMLAHWSITTDAMSEKLKMLTREMYQRTKLRTITDGEVWLCMKIARENPKTLPRELQRWLAPSAS